MDVLILPENAQTTLAEFGEGQLSLSMPKRDTRMLKEGMTPRTNPVQINWGGREFEITTPTFLDVEFAAFILQLSTARRCSQEAAAPEIVTQFWDMQNTTCNLRFGTGEYDSKRDLGQLRKKYIGVVYMVLDAKDEYNNVFLPMIKRLGTILSDFFETKKACTEFLQVPTPEYLKENTEANRQRFRGLAERVERIFEKVKSMHGELAALESSVMINLGGNVLKAKIKVLEEQKAKIESEMTELAGNQELDSRQKGELRRAQVIALKRVKLELDFMARLQNILMQYNDFREKLKPLVDEHGQFLDSLDWLARYLRSLSSTPTQMEEGERNRRVSISSRPIVDFGTGVKVKRSVPKRRAHSVATVPLPAEEGNGAPPVVKIKPRSQSVLGFASRGQTRVMETITEHAPEGDDLRTDDGLVCEVFEEE